MINMLLNAVFFKYVCPQKRKRTGLIVVSRLVHLMALFHCMVRHGTVRYGSLLGGFPLGTVPGTWYFFSTTSAEVPSEPYRYQNVTCKLY